MNKFSKIVARTVLIIFVLAQITSVSLLFPARLESSNLTAVSDTLSNSRLSFRGELSGAVPVGSGVLVLKTSGLASTDTSTGSSALVESDTLRIGTGATANQIALRTIESDTRIVLASGLVTAANDADPVIATASAIHTVRFTPSSAIPNGAFRVLIPAASASEVGDGLPDKTGFEVVGGALPAVACSGGGAGYTFETGTATASAITVASTNYHSFECRYRGNGGAGTAITMVIGTPSGNKLINPSPASTTRNPGAADTYTFRVRHTEGIAASYAVVDQSLGSLALLESVRVTATVAPTITFMLTGVAASQSICGQTTSVATTVNTVPFGTVSTTSFTDAAQMLSVSTNAVGGYSVTASESAALTALDLAGTPTIPDTTCAASPCTTTTTADWTSATSYKGFGYALANKSGTPVVSGLLYNTGGTFKARPFGRTAEQIMTNTAAVDSDQAYVCYRVVVSGTQQAGDYENQVIYIATANF